MKIKCKNCQNCELIASRKQIVCEYLNSRGGKFQPKYCPNFNPKEKVI